MTPLSVAGATITQNAEGVELVKGWVFTQQISAADAVLMRDWLIAAYPLPNTKECKCQPQ